MSYSVLHPNAGDRAGGADAFLRFLTEELEQSEEAVRRAEAHPRLDAFRRRLDAIG